MDNTVSVPFNLPNTKVIKSQIDEQGNLIIFVETTESGVDCHRCGSHTFFRTPSENRIPRDHTSYSRCSFDLTFSGSLHRALSKTHN